MPVDPVLRLAVPADGAAIAELARDSVRTQFPAYYDEAETASAAEHITTLDTALIDDGTYYVHDADGEIVACGGWSGGTSCSTQVPREPMSDCSIRRLSQHASAPCSCVRTGRGVGSAGRS